MGEFTNGNNYRIIYSALVIIVGIFTFVSMKYFMFIPDILIGVVNTSLLIYIIYFCIYDFKKYTPAKNSDKFYKLANLTLWICTSSPIIIATLNPLLVPITFLIPFSLTMYFFTRYIIEKFLFHWAIYFGSFILLPLISFILTHFYALLLNELLIFYLNISIVDYPISKFAIIVSTLIYILIVLYTEPERLKEAKVAIYLLLAVFSTFSYCVFFIDEMLLNLVTINFQIDNYEIENLGSQIQVLFNWLLLPYLIGSVWSCFAIEFKERNYKKIGIDF